MHEAYQVLLKVIRIKNKLKARIAERAAAAREATSGAGPAISVVVDGGDDLGSDNDSTENKTIREHDFPVMPFGLSTGI